MSDFNLKIEKTISFIRELYNKPEGFIPLHAPVFFGNEKKYVNECIDTTFVSSVGKFVDKFEESTAEFTGAKYAVAVVNGTAALHIALLLVGVKQDDEVITQPLTFVATANAIKHVNANPIFIDVDIDTMGLSPVKLESFLSKNTITRANSETKQKETFNKITGKRIAAIVPMHTFGHPCRIDEIVEIGDRYGIPIIEDSAESLGSFYKSKHTGTFGLFGVFSYNGNKTITAGGGGMIITDDDFLAKKAKYLTTTAKIPHPYEFVHDEVGFNYRLTNINAALGFAQMESLNVILENKRETAKAYKRFLGDIGVEFFLEPNNCKSNYWLNAVKLNDLKQRNMFLEKTNSQEIMTRPIWRLMNKLEIYDKYLCGDLTNAELLESTVVNLPSSYGDYEGKSNYNR